MAAVTNPVQQRQFALIMAISWLTSVIFLAFANFDRVGDEQGGVAEWVLGVVVSGVFAALVWLWNRNAFGRMTPRRLSMRCLLLGILAAIGIPAFWLGINAPVGVAAVVLGMESMRAPAAKPVAYAGMLLGAAGAIAGLLLCLFG